MGGMIFFAVLIFIIYSRLSNNNGNSSGNSGDQRGSKYGRALGLWCIALIGYAFTTPWSWAQPLYMAGISVLLFPSLYSALAAATGHVKISYWLGRMSLFYFGRNPHAGGLLRGFQAALRQSNPDTFRESLRWLKRRQLAHRKTIYSGEMVIYVLIDSLLASRPTPETIARNLDPLADIGTESIPAGVSVLALRYALAPALASGDWDRIARVCDQWDTPATNPLALYLKEFHGHYVKGGPIYTTANLAYWRLRAWRYGAVIRYAQAWRRDQRARTGKEMTPLQRLWCEPGSSGSLPTALLSPAERLRWEDRALALGVRQFDTVWQPLTESVRRASGSDDQRRELTQAEYDYITHQHKTLHYLTRALEKKLASKKFGNSVECYLDWLRILQALDNLKPYSHAQLTAFSAIHRVLWDWGADLWNKQNQRCLVHFVATYCAPLAQNCGHQEMFEVFSGLSQGKYK